MPRARHDPLAAFHPVARQWFIDAFVEPTPAQQRGWLSIATGNSTLIQAPTGSGKTLAAFFWAINRLMFDEVPPARSRCRVLYISPLKALAVDVDRNLRRPLSEIAARATAGAISFHEPTVSVRTGDTPQAERARFRRAPTDILITTPESLYLLLTSESRDALASVRTVIVDEVHALVPTKRGAHLALSLERLERLCAGPIQRIGLSATQRPLEEVARYLGGADTQGQGHTRGPRRAKAPRSPLPERVAAAELALHGEFGDPRRDPAFRPVTIVATSTQKPLDLHIDVPVEDMARLAQATAGPPDPGVPPGRISIWSAIYPRLLELVRAHRSTLLFVNNRRSAERIAGAINDLAGESLVRAHHGSMARAQRTDIEEALKAGLLRGLVATSSLELGIDMGAIDLVVQIESPPSVASGLQRVGRSGHQVDATSRAFLFPKFRSDLLACATVARAMRDGLVEATRYPRNPLDVLAQQIVAITAMEPWSVDDLFALVRGAAPFSGLSRAMFDGVLDMLSGRYPSDDFAELRPRLTWDRTRGTAVAREGAKRIAVVSGGTIPDRGLYGVYLAGAAGGAARVGELDEEMVFESRVGETFVLGATTWRIDTITHDRVIVSPAPGEPGKVPFWKADAPGRPIELGLKIGQLARTLRELPTPAALVQLTTRHDLDERAAENLLRYLADQAAATGVVPDDRTVVVERGRDEVGDWRVCVLSSLGSRIHAPWAMAAVAHIRAVRQLDVQTMWTDDGFVVRFPEMDAPPDPSLLVPAADDIEHLVISQLGSTAYFAARFREAAGRALLLPKRWPGQRAPLWQQRKRASDLLAVASRFGSFPIVLEAYRECLRDDFDLPALIDVVRRLERRSIRLVTVDTATPSPFAASLLFGYVANYLYDGDAPLAERRAQALTVDQEQLRGLIGTADLRDLLDAHDLDEVEREIQGLDGRRAARSADGVHDLLLRLGDLSAKEAAARTDGDAATWLSQLVSNSRVVVVAVGDERRFVAVEHAAQYRDALGTALPTGVPPSLLTPVPLALEDIISRFTRTHGPFQVSALGARFGISDECAVDVLRRLVGRNKVVEGAFRPGASGPEWCAPDVLRVARRQSLARLRHEAAPVEPAVLGRFLTKWQGVGSGRRGLDALLDVIETLQGAAVPASVLESSILPARVADYDPADLDTLAAAGEIRWVGVDPIGQRDGRVALYLTENLPRLMPPGLRDSGSRSGEATLPDRERAVLATLRQSGASLFGALQIAAGGGYPGETVAAIWALVWKGLITNDSFQPLRLFVRPPGRSRAVRPTGTPFRSRRLAPPSTEGRWCAVDVMHDDGRVATTWATTLTDRLLARYGVLIRDVAGLESVPGGFGSIYPVLRAYEDAGHIRRGYFVTGVAATQFARPAAVDMLRELRAPLAESEAAVLAATDPANPYGHLLRWPSATLDSADVFPTFARSVGAMVALVDGHLSAFWRTGHPDVGVFLPPEEPDRARVARALAAALATVATTGEGRTGGLLIATINGHPAAQHALAPFLAEAGFVPSALGYHVPRAR